MAKKASAGLLLYRRRKGLEILLVHPGGPFWAKKDYNAWSLPKGEFEPGEDPLEAAKRELFEETGLKVEGEFCRLKPVRQAGGKIVHAWAIEAEWDTGDFRSNSFSIEWPPRSGRMQHFPEVDRAAWFSLDEARCRILKSQTPFLDQLAAALNLE
jgi:predicted NUDIX family NTP pyrophosphohydrolase